MSKLTDKWIEIFRAGTFHKGSDTETTFSANDVQQIVDNYDPAQYEAPAVIGHPKHDAPACAWFSELKRDGDVLLGKMKDVQPAFEKAVEDRRFPNRSAKLLKDAVKGWTLRHVGYLGAQLPEVKGLAPIQFGSEDDKAIEIEFSEEREMAEDQKLTFKEWLATLLPAKENGVQAHAFSEADVQRIATEAVTAAVKPLQVKLDAQAVTFSEREKALTTTESEQRAQTAIARVKAKGAWVPAFTLLGVPQLFSELAKQPATVTLEFGEGATKKTLSPLDAMVEFMESLGAIVPRDNLNFAGTRTTPIKGKGDARADALHAQTLEFMEKHEGVDYGKAQLRVIGLNPELVAPGSSSNGQA